MSISFFSAASSECKRARERELASQPNLVSSRTEGRAEGGGQPRPSSSSAMSYYPPPEGHPLASLSAAAAAAHSRSNGGPGPSSSSSLVAGSPSSLAFPPSSSMPHPGSSTGPPAHPHPHQHPHHPHVYLAGHHSLMHSPESTTSPEHHHHASGGSGAKRRRTDMDGGESPGTAHGGGGGKKGKSKTVSCTECKVRSRSLSPALPSRRGRVADAVLLSVRAEEEDQGAHSAPARRSLCSLADSPLSSLAVRPPRPSPRPLPRHDVPLADSTPSAPPADALPRLLQARRARGVQVDRGGRRARRRRAALRAHDRPRASRGASRGARGVDAGAPARAAARRAEAGAVRARGVWEQGQAAAGRGGREGAGQGLARAWDG